MRWFAFGGVALIALLGVGAASFFLGQSSSSAAATLEIAEATAPEGAEPAEPPDSQGDNTRKIGAWEHRSDRDAFTDKVFAWISVAGEQARFAIKCDEPGSIYVIVFHDEYIGGGNYETRNLLVRRDNGPAEEQRWRHDADYAAILDHAKALQFADSLIGVKRLALRVRDYNFHSYDTTFELGSETERALQALYETCEVAER